MRALAENSKLDIKNHSHIVITEKEVTPALCVNWQKADEGRIDKSRPSIFAADETEDLGEKLGTSIK